MLCLVPYLFVSSTSVFDCLGRFVSEMTYYVSSGTLNRCLMVFIDRLLLRRAYGGLTTLSLILE